MLEGKAIRIWIIVSKISILDVIFVYIATSSGRQIKPQYRFRLKNKEREMYLESFRKMQELKVSNDENW